MTILKELVFIVGASVIARNDIKHGNTDVPKKQKSKAINTIDETITMIVNLIRNGFPPEADQDFKEEIISSFSRLSREYMVKIENIHIATTGDKSLLQKSPELH